MFGSDGLFDGRHLGYGLVPDGITTVVVNGTPLEVRDDVFHLLIPKTTHRVSVDFLTDEGVVTAWHQDLPVAIERPPAPSRVEAFGAQARLLQDQTAVSRSVVRTGERHRVRPRRHHGLAPEAGHPGRRQGVGAPGGARRPGTRWLGDPPVTVPVSILVFSRPGSASSAAMRVRLPSGWG